MASPLVIFKSPLVTNRFFEEGKHLFEVETTISFSENESFEYEGVEWQITGKTLTIFATFGVVYNYNVVQNRCR